MYTYIVYMRTQSTCKYNVHKGVQLLSYSGEGEISLCITSLTFVGDIQQIRLDPGGRIRTCGNKLPLDVNRATG